MRISTAQYFETSASKYTDNYSSVVKAQEQASSGVRVQTAADDPVAAARLLLLQQQKDMLGQFNGNITSLKNSLTNEESVLGAINEALQAAVDGPDRGGDGDGRGGEADGHDVGRVGLAVGEEDRRERTHHQHVGEAVQLARHQQQPLALGVAVGRHRGQPGRAV